MSQPPKPDPSKPALTKAGPRDFLFDLNAVARVDAGPGYTSATGQVVEGERMMVGLMRLRAGEVTALHSHPNEQWIYVLEGVFIAEVDGETFEAGPGTVVYQPAGIVHGGRAGPDGDLVFFTVKDTSHGLHGTRAS